MPHHVSSRLTLKNPKQQLCENYFFLLAKSVLLPWKHQALGQCIRLAAGSLVHLVRGSMEAPCNTCPYRSRSITAEQSRTAKILLLLQLLVLPIPGMSFLLLLQMLQMLQVLLVPLLLRLLLGEFVEQPDFAQLAGLSGQAAVAEVLLQMHSD
jgi:hypothetical protein